jgi:subtilase family serine protease
VFAEPTWQSGPGVANTYSNQMREVPDVALDADPHTGYSIYTTNNGSTGWRVVAGTSGAAPSWAAFIALVNQYRLASGAQPALGFVNPTLYRLGSGLWEFAPFHDVTTGNNLFYSATRGWDFATGWGSFDAFNLVRDLGSRSLPAPAVPTTPRPARTLPPPLPSR